MPGIRHLIEEHEQRLIARWAVAVVADGEQHLPETTHEQIAAFLHELGTALTAAGSQDRPVRADDRAQAAPVMRGGLDVSVATRAFGGMHCLLLELAAEHDVALSAAEQITLASHINAAIARVAEQSPRERGEISSHVSHQLRNPLGSAMMALTLLRSRVEFGSEERLVDTLDRNLKRLQRLIEDSTASQGTLSS